MTISIKKVTCVKFGESSAKPGGSRGHGRMILLSLKIILVKN